MTAKPATDASDSKSPEGLLLLDKPAGITSHDAIQLVRRAYREKSVGHLGTLDPFATGLLIILVGRATRLASFLDAEPKVYEALIAFGNETNTDDLTGEVVRTANPPDAAAVRAAIAELSGDIQQIPPAFSAKQIDGQRAYVSARKGEKLELDPVRVTVHEWKINKLDGGKLNATIVCSGGTYIRALARDLGRKCESAAHLESLRRIRSGVFDVRDAVTVEQLQSSPPRLRQLHVQAESSR
jgi:tRNA pseudouridine55 synthase